MIPQTTSKSPLNALQKVVVTRLKGDATLATLLGSSPSDARVVDQPREGMPYPYVRVGDTLSTADDDLTSFGRSVVMTLHIWTKKRGTFSGQEILNRIVELLDHQTAAVSALLEAEGHRVVRIAAEFDQALTDPDPEIRHHVLRFRVATAQLS
ncbi:MAG: DUF3168 domain-containing protein [Actinoplanes sp.]